ncbi:MAG: hypothetical protein AB8G96_12720 [Phycisphaerales bacterium]
MSVQTTASSPRSSATRPGLSWRFRVARRRTRRRIGWTIILAVFSLHASAVLLGRYEMPPGEQYALPANQLLARGPAPTNDELVLHVHASVGVRHLVVASAGPGSDPRPSHELPEWATEMYHDFMVRSDGIPSSLPGGGSARYSMTARGIPWPALRAGAIEVMDPTAGPVTRVHFRDHAIRWAAPSRSPMFNHPATIVGASLWTTRATLIPVMPLGWSYVGALVLHGAVWWITGAAIAWSRRSCRRRIRRRRTMVLGCIGGVVITFGLAAAGHTWSPEVRDPLAATSQWAMAQRSPSIEVAGPHGPHQGVHFIRIDRWRTGLSTWHTSQWRSESLQDRFPEQPRLMEWMPAHLPELLPGGPDWTDPREVRVAQTVGWPWRCFKASAGTTRSVTDAAGTRSLSPYVRTDAAMSPFEPLRDGSRLLPVTPIPSGLAGNLAAWSLVSWIGMAGLHARRAWHRTRGLRRRRSGCCRRCGHRMIDPSDEPALWPSRCPECGGA